MEKNWKNYLLSTGLPLENEVLNFLNKKKYLTDFDTSYIRLDETGREKEFAYDIRATSLEDTNYFTELFIECKYRYPGTKWLFIPEIHPIYDPYNPTPPVYAHPLSWIHITNISQKKISSYGFPRETGIPLASKGIELLPKNDNPKSLQQAYNQLGYAFAEEIIDQIDSLINDTMPSVISFFNIPIIITTADLYLLNSNISIENINQSGELEEISTKQDILIVSYTNKKQLTEHNQKIFFNFYKNKCDNLPKSIQHSIKKTLDESLSFPQTFVIIKYSEDKKGFEILFEELKKFIKSYKK